jgi:prevent-host-death family protein
VSRVEIGMWDLSNRTTAVIDAVRAGERVTLTVNGEAVADIVAPERRMHRLPGALMHRQLVKQGRAADPALARELEGLVGDKLERP